jgi:hypothetical protein
MRSRRPHKASARSWPASLRFAFNVATLSLLYSQLYPAGLRQRRFRAHADLVALPWLMTACVWTISLAACGRSAATKSPCDSIKSAMKTTLR